MQPLQSLLLPMKQTQRLGELTMNIVKSCWIAASVTLLGTTLAFAISPHFLRASDSIEDNG